LLSTGAAIDFIFVLAINPTDLVQNLPNFRADSRGVGVGPKSCRLVRPVAFAVHVHEREVAMPQVDLKERFPNMTPVKSPPTLTRLNGCGVAMFGKRDFDSQTQTYVATWCISILFIPVFCLRAYRVAVAQRGWYFIGREPLSSFAKWCNISLVTAIVVVALGIQYDRYASSPAYKAHRQMAHAADLVKQGQLAQGANIYENLALAGADESSNATQAIEGLVNTGCASAPLGESAEVFSAAAQVARRGSTLAASDVAGAGMKLVADKGDADPRGGVAMLDAIRPLVIDTRAIDARRLALLRKWAAADPTNLDVLVPLASLLEQQNDLPGAKKFLLPVKDRLGDGEGARVLGTILAREGDFDGSYAMLWPYVKVRLDRLHAAERNSEDTVKGIYGREIDLLKNDKAPADFYEKYKNSSEDEQKALVRNYVNARVKDDPEYAASQQALEQETRVVPVAMDLGIVMLQRAQGQSDPPTRKSQLESTEKVFLAIGGVAGESDQYRLSLGQVYYWLGKQVEGHKLFDDYLTSKGRAFADLLSIGTRLRALGAEPEARVLAEEAYNKASKPDEQHEAAQLRYLLAIDNDDNIAWLNKSDTADPTIKAELAKALGDKAAREGNDEEAVRQYHVCIDAYTAMPRSSSTVNQTALGYYGIFLVNGDHQALDRCLDYFQQAVELEPSNSILLFNAGITLLDGSIAEVIGNDLDLRLLHQGGDVGLLSYLYHDQPTRAALIARVKAHPGIARAISYLQKVMVLAPKSERAPGAIFGIRKFTRDDDALRLLDQRISAADIDASDELTHVKQFLSGEKDPQDQMAINAALKRNQDQSAAARARGGATAALSLARQVEQRLSLDACGGAADPAQVVALAEEARGVCPCEETYSTLLSAYLFRGADQLRHADPAFDAFCAKYKRSVGPSYLMAVAASEPSSFQQAVLQNPDMQRALALIRESAASYPEGRSAYEWALLKNSDAGEADRIADVIRRTPREPVSQSIANHLAPANATEALNTYWLMQILAKPEEGKAALARVAALGIPMPVQP
jgi:hypothetical protein